MDSRQPTVEVQWQTLAVSNDDRMNIKGHPPVIIWLTGIPASGKTTIARELKKKLHEIGGHTYIPDLPEIIIETDRLTLAESVEKIVGYLHDKGFLKALKYNCCTRAIRK